MTEQDLKNQAAKLKAIYAQNMNTTRQNSIADYNADKTAFTTDANTQLAEQKDTTQTTKTNADINAFNNAKKLREMASAGGFTNGGELFSGTIQNEQQKGNTIGNANNAFTKYKGQWDSKLNEYNTKWNNNLNKLNSETDNAINEYNTKLDMDYNDKIESLRQQLASAAASRARSSSGSSSSSSGGKVDSATTKTQLMEAYNYQMTKGNENYPATAQWLRDNQETLVKAGLWNTVSKDFSGKYGWTGTPMNTEQQKLQAFYNGTGTLTNGKETYSTFRNGVIPNRTQSFAGQGTTSGSTKTTKPTNTYTDYFNRIASMFTK